MRENILALSNYQQKAPVYDMIHKTKYECTMDVLGAMAVFIRVAELHSLSATAQDLHVSQPAVSQKIAALEHYVGARLIN